MKTANSFKPVKPFKPVGQQEKKDYMGYGMSNPVIRKMSRKAKTIPVDGEAATYQGIMSKTVYFAICCIIGVIGFFVLHTIFMKTAGTFGGTVVLDDLDDLKGIVTLHTCLLEMILFAVSGIIVAFLPLLAWLIRPAIPVIGTLYAFFEGYFVGMMILAFEPEYKWIPFAAFALTVLVVGSMLYLYVKKNVRLSGNVKMVVFATFITSILGGIILVVLSFIPALRPMVIGITSFMGNPIVGIILSIVFIVVAALFLLAEFEMIQKCVDGQMSKKLEWMAAFGLIYTVIYIYFKILNLIIQVVAQSKK